MKEDVIRNPDRKDSCYGDGNSWFVYEKDYGEGFGLCVIKVGESEKDSDIDSFFPYLRGQNFLFNEDIEGDPSSDREGYFGYCEDNNVGIPLIFTINDPLEYRRSGEVNEDEDGMGYVSLTGLALDGIVLLPIEMNDDGRDHERQKLEKRNDMINAAKMGDVEAIENLTIEDMATFTKVNLRTRKEDIFTIVSSYFMPYTVECDKYSVLAEITHVARRENRLTGEKLYCLSLNCNSIEFDVLINEKNLMGVPWPGRRLKCHVWLQGQLDYITRELYEAMNL